MPERSISTRHATRDRRIFPGKTLRVAAERPALLRAREGQVWVTFETTEDTGARRDWDYFLQRGQCMRLDPGEVVLVGPSDARRGVASFDVEPIALLPRRPAPAWRRWLARVLQAWPARPYAGAHA